MTDDTQDSQSQLLNQAANNAAQTLEPSDFVIKIKGQLITELPQDLYIPPEALEVFLETFQGPLDLLLYLIKKQNLDILDIPIADITEQYMGYVEIMKAINLELAAEYLVMAATLAEIKSRMLLPKSPHDEEMEDDPRAELVRRLQEYERFKRAAEDLDALPRQERDIFVANAEPVELSVVKKLPHIELNDMLKALRAVMRRAALQAHHHVQMEPLSIRERMSTILDTLSQSNFRAFTSFFSKKEGRLGVVVTFIAMLELMKVGMIEFVQAEPYAPIHLRKREQLETDASL
ncbi:MAG: segregation/condensation protein A [Gammaproteobacteria bacterium CG11_big_fil_rev_8_21_14_0_20_46_22]|nr:MAG: segregation/condensation protein A [Gammaproteobacteria bacterium CG12_big_fil_rev_8_21_14_0_65_46_12]PIR12156.1 MAG: segregation/condensation protein A [Gammaproteobacteria bacterium CG11_big_fil_rev_8_21_14_0_20_46_22]